MIWIRLRKAIIGSRRSNWLFSVQSAVWAAVASSAQCAPDRSYSLSDSSKDTLIFCSPEIGNVVNIWSRFPNQKQASVGKFTKHIMGNGNVKIPLPWDTLFTWLWHHQLILTWILWYRFQRKYLWVVRGKSATGSYAADTHILQSPATYFENGVLQKMLFRW